MDYICQINLWWVWLSFIWNDHIHKNRNVLKSVLKQKLLDQYIQHWFQQINSSSRGEFYGIFKTEFKLEPYLIRLHPSDRIYMCKLRCSNLKLPIETGRWANILKQNRKCHLCKYTGLTTFVLEQTLIHFYSYVSDHSKWN
jgi:hypothetical protein